jgi:hypothetical protein
MGVSDWSIWAWEPTRVLFNKKKAKSSQELLPKYQIHRTGAPVNTPSVVAPFILKTALGGGRRTCGGRPPPEDLATSAASGTLELLGARGVREFDLGGGDLPEIILLRIPVQHPDACS